MVQHRRMRVNRIAFSPVAILVIAAAFSPLCASAAGGDNSFSSETLSGTHSLTGYLSSKYIVRTTSISGEQASDQDIFVQMRFDATTKERQGTEFHFLGVLRGDVDDNRNQNSFYPLEDTGDAYSSWVAGYAYEAHLDMNHLQPYLTQLRVGRQAGTRDEAVFFDGIGADLEVTDRLNLTAYGGAAVHLYEVNNDWGSDTLGGLGMDYSPARTTGMSLDYLAAHDKRNALSFTDRNDQLLSFRLRQRISSYLSMMARYRYLNGEPRDLTVRAVDAFPRADMQLSASYVKQFSTQNELSNELSLYYDVLGQSRPYQSFDGKVRKLFGRHVALDLGYFTRSLLEGTDENALNRSYRRYYAVVELSDVLREGLTFSLVGEHWATTSRELNSGGLDAAYSFTSASRNARINAGTYYSLYKYDYYVMLGERQQVRTYYVKGKIPLSRNYFLSGSYEYEDSIENYQTAKVEISYAF
jgi:hypothetical protein